MEDLHTFVESLVINKIEEDMRENVAPAFWSEFYNLEDDPERNFIRFKNAVADLNTKYLAYLPTMHRLEEMRAILSYNEPIYGETNLLVILKLIIRTVLHSQLPIPKYQTVIEEFYKLSFKVFYNADKSSRGNYTIFNSHSLCIDEFHFDFS